MTDNNFNILKTLRRIALEMSTASSPQHALNLVVEDVKENLHADACSIFLVNEEQGEYVFMATVGLNAKLVGRARLKLGQGLVGLVGEREEPINLEDASKHPKFYHYPDIEEDNYRGFIGVPLISQGELHGVLIVQQRASRLFAEEEEAFLITLATQLAIFIAHARGKGAFAEFDSPRGRKRKTAILSGVPGSQGVATGQAIVVYPPADLDSVPERETENISEETKLFEQALSRAREEIHEIQHRAKNKLSVAETALFDAYLRILDSRSLMNEVIQEIEKGFWAQGALKRVIKRHEMHFESLDDAYLRERAADFRDLGRRILSHLQEKVAAQLEFPKNMILVSEEVTATLLMEVPEGCLIGVVSGSGSANSHVAILARALGLPTVMGVTGTPLDGLDNKELIVDGYNGQVYISPSSSLKKEFRSLALEEQQLDRELELLRDLPAETKDGYRVPMYVNTGLAVENKLSLSVGAEGVGLYRTEMPFMLRDRFPSEEEQRIMYRQLLNIFAPRPVVMRTLDIGGDKALSYFPLQEDNPFLGWRGVRVMLDHPEIFLQQVRAMIHASLDLDNLSIMIPMITTVNEVEESIRLINQAYQELLEEKIAVKRPLLGIMIEVPGAVYQAYELARRVDFVSVGSNDLIQYLLAVDRNNPRVADLYNGLHPAVTRALNDVVKAVHRAGKPISICGELAGDPMAAVLLLGMEFDSFSMSAKSIPRVKWMIRNFHQEKAKEILKNVLKLEEAIDVRCYMELVLEEAGMGSLIRAGK